MGSTATAGNTAFVDGVSMIKANARAAFVDADARLGAIESLDISIVANLANLNASRIADEANLVSLNTAAAAITAEVTNRNTAVAAEAALRLAADTAEASARSNADASIFTRIVAEAALALSNTNTESTQRLAADTAEASTRSNADAAIFTRIDAEAATRTTALAAIFTRIDAEAVIASNNLSVADASIFTRIQAEALLALSNTNTESTQRSSADVAIIAMLTAEQIRASAAEAAFPALTRQGHRPGETLMGFTQSLSGGDPALLPALPPGLIVFGDSGFVARVTGAAIIAERSLHAVEPNRLYKARFVVQRRIDTNDPSGDSVVMSVAWYDQARNPLVGVSVTTAIQTLTNLKVSDGRQDFSALTNFARAGGGGISFVAPAGAVYARAFVQTYGTTPQTDIEVCTIADITDQATASVDVTATNARVAALESLSLGARTLALESAVTAPNSFVFATQADAHNATIAGTVLVVKLLGKTVAGDGDGGDYVKVGASTPGGFTSANGIFFARINRFSPFDVALLPTTLPAIPGIWWLDGGALSVSQ